MTMFKQGVLLRGGQEPRLRLALHRDAYESCAAVVGELGNTDIRKSSGFRKLLHSAPVCVLL